MMVVLFVEGASVSLDPKLQCKERRRKNQFYFVIKLEREIELSIVKIILLLKKNKY